MFYLLLRVGRGLMKNACFFTLRYQTYVFSRQTFFKRNLAILKKTSKIFWEIYTLAKFIKFTQFHTRVFICANNLLISLDSGGDKQLCLQTVFSSLIGHSSFINIHIVFIGCFLVLIHPFFSSTSKKNNYLRF